MKRTLGVCAGGLIVALAVGVLWARDEAAPAKPGVGSGHEADAEAIRAMARDFVAAFNKHNAAALTAQWTEQAECTDADGQTVRGAAGAIARACHTRKSPLTVIQSDHIVVVSPIRASDTDRVVQSLNETHARLARRDMRLAIGVSTVQPGLAGIATALLEALGAAQCLGSDGGVFALPALSAFEYLTAFRDATAERLVSPAVTNFVSSDLASGGVLVATLLAYVDCDLNVKALSERISVHVNTAHYRLNKVAELTGSDLRRLRDVLDLVVAIRFAMSRGDRPPGVWR